MSRSAFSHFHNIGMIAKYLAHDDVEKSMYLSMPYKSRLLQFIFYQDVLKIL